MGKVSKEAEQLIKHATRASTSFKNFTSRISDCIKQYKEFENRQNSPSPAELIMEEDEVWHIYIR